MEYISSRDNQRIKQVRRVRDGGVKDLIFVEGLRLAEEFLLSENSIGECFYTKRFRKNERGRRILETIPPDRVFEVSDHVFSSLVATKNSQGIVIIGAKPVTGKEVFVKNKGANERFPHVILLHQVNNPGNLGAILRTCEAVGCSRLITTKNSADAFAPNSLRAAMGAAFRLNVWMNADFYQALDWARENDFVTICADVKAAEVLWNVDWQKPRLIVFGAESHGLTDAEIGQIDESFKIPMENEVESLNLAVSSGIVLFAARGK